MTIDVRLDRPQSRGARLGPRRQILALTASTRLTFDYQFVDNAGYNADRGPVNIFAACARRQL